MSRLYSIGVLVLAGAITFTTALVHGRWTSRWGAPQLMTLQAEVLQRLAKDFGPWQMIQASELPQAVRGILQCADYRQAVYRNRDTGEQVLCTLLLGPAGPMSVHTPEICYTSIDSEALGPRRRVQLSPGVPQDSFWMVQFREVHEPSVGILRVYYAWNEGTGSWTAAEEPRVTFGGHPFLFKVQVSTTLPESAETGSQDPAHDFLPFFTREFAHAVVGPKPSAVN